MSLVVENLSVAYKERLALREVSLTVSPGEVVALIGPNGAGKTTLLRAISGLLPFRGGEIKFAGQNLANLPPRERARMLAVVPQARHLPPAFSVRHTVLLGRTPYLGLLGQPRTEDNARVDAALGQVDLTEFAERPVGELSGGEQQLVLLARALAQDTPLLLLDEPTAHLDLRHQGRILDLVRGLAQDYNLAVLMALHDLNLAAHYAGRVALLVEGRLLALGAATAVLTHETLSAAYGHPVRVRKDPDTGAPLVLPRDTPPSN